MARSFKELGRESTELIEQGKEVDRRVQNCKAQVQSAAASVASARMSLENASQVDEEGNPRGDVSAASARVAVAQNQMAAAQRALQNAQQEAERINQRKRQQIQKMEEHNRTARSNLARLSELSGKSFSENADEVQSGLIDRFNEIEQARIALLESMGEKASPETLAAAPLSGSASDWSGEALGALDVEGVQNEPTSLNGSSGSVINNTTTPLNTGISNNTNENGSFSNGEDANSDNPLNQAKLNPNSTQTDLYSEVTEEDEKVLSLDRQSLSPDQLYVLGIKHLNEQEKIWRENLHNRGIDDGLAMTKALNTLRYQHMVALSKDIETSGSSMYDINIDFDEIANRIMLDPNYKRNQEGNNHFIYSDNDRQEFRNKIMSGDYTEADIRSRGAEVNKLLKGYKDIIRSEFDNVNLMEKELLTQLASAKTPSEINMLEAKRKLLSNERNRIYDNYICEQKNVFRDVLGRFRPVGPVDDSKQSFHSSYQPNDSKVIKAINVVRNYFPSTWVEEGNTRTINVAFEDRGYYSSSENKIALSGKRDMVACAFHEMSHRLEDMYPGIVEVERQFYDRRTKGKDLQWLGEPYSKKEMFRDGSFIHNYMGKDYGGQAYELLSMGMESVYCGSFDLDKDPEYRDLIYGILTML